MNIIVPGLALNGQASALEISTRPKTETIARFLEVHAPEAHRGRYHAGREVQILVEPGDGVLIRAGKRTGSGLWQPRDGGPCYYHFRLPHATNPDSADTPLRYSLEEHVRCIGLSGWNYRDRASEEVILDLDDAAGHKGGGVPAEQIQDIEAKIRAVPCVSIYTSKSGEGRHFYIEMATPVPTATRAEHRGLGRAVLHQVCRDAGVDPSLFDVVGANAWIYHRGMKPGGLVLLHRGEPLDHPPEDWRSYIGREKTKRRKASVSVPPLDEDDAAWDVTPLDAGHNRLLEWLDGSDWVCNWDPDVGVLHTHTWGLQEAHEALGLRGVYETISGGTDPATQNCYAYPRPDGAWYVGRWNDTEAPCWTKQEGRVHIIFNPAPEIWCSGTGSKRRDFVVMSGGEEVYRKTIDVTNPKSRAKLVQEITEASQLPVEAVAAKVEALRTARSDYAVRDGMLHCGRMPLCNFDMSLLRDVTLRDDFQSEHWFEGEIRHDGRTSPIKIPAADWGDDKRLMAAIYDAAGSGAIREGKVQLIRAAVSALSRPERIVRTTAHGWDESGGRYLTPTGVIDRDGFREYRDGELRVDLGTAGPPAYLGLIGGDVAPVRRHILDAFLRLHGRAVMFSLFGAVALAVLERFGGGAQRPALWLRGLTGVGKTFPSRLAMNFHGAYTLDDGGQFVGWTSTANYVERMGYYFRDCLYLVDDYKPTTIPPHLVARIIQNYADRAGRGRLHADASAQVTRPIRGLLLATGEDLPQQDASVLARTIVVDVPQGQPRDPVLRRRCLEMWPHYRVLLADFIRWLIAQDRLSGFAGRVEARRETFYRDIAGQQNDLRIAGNFALLAAAFEEFALYFDDPWLTQEGQRYVKEDLITIRDQMLGHTQEQQEGEIFLAKLRLLREFKKVYFQGDARDMLAFGGAAIGRVTEEGYDVSIPMALAAVQDQLKQEGRPVLKCSDTALLNQLEGMGVLVDPKAKDGRRTSKVRVGGENKRCARIRKEALELGAAGASEE